MFRAFVFVGVLGSLLAGSNYASASTGYSCSSAVAEATARFAAAGFLSPEKPMQFAIAHRGAATLSAAEFRLLTGSLRGASALCRAGESDAAAERLVPALATLDRIERRAE